MRERIGIAVAVVGIVVAVVAAPGQRTNDPDPRVLGTNEVRQGSRVRTPTEPRFVAAGDPVALEKFADCDAFVRHVRARASEIVGPNGFDGDDWAFVDAPVASSAGVGMDAAFTLPGAPPPVPMVAPHSQTNVQVAGVDEPDIVKTDGRTIYWMGTRSLRAIVLEPDGSMREAGSIKVRGWDPKLLLAGDRVLAISSAWRAHTSITRITTIDVTDPDAMVVESTTELDGSFVSARLIGGTARVVVSSEQPRNLRFAYPHGSTGPDVIDAIERNRRVIARSPTSAWLPRLRVKDASSSTTRPLVACSQVYAPKAFSGLGMLSVVTLDPARPSEAHTASIFGGGETVYATAERLFVATTKAVQTSDRRAFDEVWTTQIHAFDIGDAAGARYVASGEVEGQLKDQWALDLHDEHLRVATTLGVPWRRSSESAVTVLAFRGDRLEQVGRVGDLGEPGEQIYAVRFIGDAGYVVTFRLIDPLYVLDLSDPTQPRVTGELKIPGYSAYLHPIGDELLLGIGQSATARGITRGTQVSLFDVADPADPQRIDQLSFVRAHSEAEADHHAFMFWPDTGSLVVPLSEFDDRPFVGAAGIKVQDRSLTEVARITHQRGTLEQIVVDPWSAQVRRSVVVGDTLYTLSARGILASDIQTYDERGWLGWQRRLDRVQGIAGRDAGFRDGWGSRARFRNPGQIALGFGGEIWVADTGNSAVRTVQWGETRTMVIEHADGSTNTTFPGAPVGVAPRPDGGAFVATSCGVWVLPGTRARPALVAGDCAEAGGVLGPVDGSGANARFGSIRQIARAADGSILVVDTGAHAIRRVLVNDDNVGTVTTIAGSLGRPGHADGPAAQARFTEPAGITVLASGDVLVADTGNHVVRRLAHGSWRVATIAGTPGRPSGPAGLDAPTAIAFDPVTERIFVTDGHRVSAIRERAVSRIAGDRTGGLRRGDARAARFRSPTGLVVMGEMLVVSDTGNHRLRSIK